MSRANSEKAPQQRIHELKYEVSQRDESLSQIRPSTSWKVTAPLRAVRRLLK
jgi:hypothetical protein